MGQNTKTEKIGYFLLSGWIVTTLIWWSFAFAPISSETPEWFRQAQYVCFGSVPGGLPNSGGWLLLIGSPLMLFLALQIGFFDEIRGAFKYISISKSAKLLYAFFFIFTLGQTFNITKKIKTALTANSISFENIDPSEFPDNYPKINNPLPEFTHISHLATSISNKDSLGKVGIITFVFSHCATVCPTLTRTIINVMGKLPAEKTYAWFFTLDPWRDTPNLISQQASIWNLPINAYLISDRPYSIQKTLDTLKVPRSRNEKTGEVTHPGLVYVINQKGQIEYMFNNPSPEWLLQAVQRILANDNITETKAHAEQYYSGNHN